MSDGPSPTIAYHRPPSEPDLEATVAAVPTESGGRRYALFSGYRPMHAFGVSGTLYDALHEYPDGPVEPGQSGRALLWLLQPELQRGAIFEGMEFTVQEGRRVVARGRIVKVLNEDLRRAV